MTNSPNHPNGQQPYLIIGAIAAIVTIFIFATGIVDLPSILSAEGRLQRKMIGTWEDSRGGTMSFYENGSFDIQGGLLPVSGFYNVTDKNRVTLQMSGLLGIAGNQTWIVSVSGSQMTITASDGDSFSMTKIR